MLLSSTESAKELRQLELWPVCFGPAAIGRTLSAGRVQPPRFSLKPMSWIFMLLGSFTELVGRTEPKLRYALAGTCRSISVWERTVCLGVANAAEAVARTSATESAIFELVNMVFLRFFAVIKGLP